MRCVSLSAGCYGAIATDAVPVPGLPDEVCDHVRTSPAEKLVEVPAALQLVAVPLIVHVATVVAPFLAVNVYDLPPPGAMSDVT